MAEQSPVDEALGMIRSFVTFAPDEGDDTIRYLYKARELADVYDEITACDSDDEMQRLVIFMEYLLKMAPFDVLGRRFR